MDAVLEVLRERTAAGEVSQVAQLLKAARLDRLRRR